MKTLVGFTVGALATLVLATAADAFDGGAGIDQGGNTLEDISAPHQVPDRGCAFRYTLFFGQNNPGNITAHAGKLCRVNFTTGPRSGRQSGFDAIFSVLITERPRNGTAVIDGQKAIRFQPKLGFTGKDSMTVRYKGNGQGQPRETTVTFAIDVH
jgi:hypothetical protein